MNNLPQQLEKMNELNHLPGFRHDAKLIDETGKLDHSKHSLTILNSFFFKRSRYARHLNRPLN